MVYKRGKNYSYKFRWTVALADGRRESYIVRKSAKTANKQDARDAQDEHRRALRLGLIHPLDPWPQPKAPAAPTFRTFVKTFQAHAETHTKKGTARFYGISIDRLLAYSPIADADLPNVTGEIVSKYAQRQLAAEMSIASVNADVRTIRRILNLAEEWGLIARAPRTHELPGQKGRERVVSFTEEAKYLAKASATVRDLAILAVDTGLRPNSELFPLQWSAVALKGTQDAPHGTLRIRIGKTPNAVRVIPLTPRANEVLKQRKAKAKGFYVFPGPGNSGHIQTVQHAHFHATEKAEIEFFPFYCWRHTFGTRCAESGMDRFTLARLMGHSSPRVAERYYVHITETHVATGFGKFLEYQNSNLSKVIGDSAHPEQ